MQYTQNTLYFCATCLTYINIEDVHVSIKFTFTIPPISSVAILVMVECMLHNIKVMFQIYMWAIFHFSYPLNKAHSKAFTPDQYADSAFGINLAVNISY